MILSMNIVSNGLKVEDDGLLAKFMLLRWKGQAILDAREIFGAIQHIDTSVIIKAKY